MVLTTRMLTPETWEDFAALVESNNGVWGAAGAWDFTPGDPLELVRATVMRSDSS